MSEHSLSLGKQACLACLGIYGMAQRHRGYPNSLSLFFFFPLLSPFNSAWPVASLWSLLFALQQIPDCPSSLCKHWLKLGSHGSSWRRQTIPFDLTKVILQTPALLSY